MSASRELWPDEYTVFNILYDKFLFWSIVVGIFTFTWLLIAVLRYRDGIEPAGKEELSLSRGEAPAVLEERRSARPHRHGTSPRPTRFSRRSAKRTPAPSERSHRLQNWTRRH